MTAPTLDSIVSEIIAAKPEEVHKDVVPLLKKLDKSSSSKSSSPNLLGGQLNDGSDPLDLLDPALHSVGYLFVLNARCAAAKPEVQALMPYIINFSERFNPAQLRLVPDQVNFFAKQVVHITQEINEAVLAVIPFRNLLTRYTSPGYLTSLHPHLTHLVMLTRSYTTIRDLLLEEIVELDLSLGPIKYHDNLMYHYLGGIILALLGQKTRAMDMLEIVVSAPGHAVAAIQIDAYKKLLLVQLLTLGQIQPLPKYTTPAVVTACKAHAGPYLDYAHAYAAQDKAGLISLLDKHREVFEKDLNTGLLTLCERAFRRRTIQKLTDTYMTLSLEEIAKAVDLGTDEKGLKEVEEEILGMMADDEIHGSISHPSTTSSRGSITVTFTDDPEPYNSHSTEQRVTNAIAKAKRIEAMTVGDDWRIARSKEFVQKVCLGGLSFFSSATYRAVY
ncbi:hypothetical protein BCR35DRAFT_281771 [Leucosporidium creatinivorum]|uniref:COP9 signalosome complex subunit 3 n=1 Tax=Leucosporidium creatinivorum TaxID=106004 RepID=A0A1Y2ENH5_9BASI|nr:hypothetical protein BCR35DRAFT_281771 [Leucosporidium creatinivorum]